jgi:hypothetical protein
MTNAVWLSAGGGVVLALLYGGASLVTHRMALRTSDQNRFLSITIGGLLARMTASLVVIAGAVAFVPLHTAAFMGSFFGVFVVTLTLEVAYLHRGADALTSDASADDAPRQPL